MDEAYIVSHFAEALKQGHIQAYFQPVFASIAEMIISAEALAGWNDPDGGMLSPADFVTALEKHGLICDLDMEILRQTCAFYRELRDRGTPVPCFSVNLSRLDFRRDNGERLFDRVVGILKAYDVPPRGDQAGDYREPDAWRISTPSRAYSVSSGAPGSPSGSTTLAAAIPG